MFYRVVDELGFFLDVQLVHDTRAVGVDRFGAEGEDLGDLVLLEILVIEEMHAEALLCRQCGNGRGDGQTKTGIRLRRG